MKTSEINKFLKENKEKSDCLRIIFKDHHTTEIGKLFQSKNQWFFIKDVDLEDYYENEEMKFTKSIKIDDIKFILIEPKELRQKSESYIVYKYLKQKRKETMENYND